MILLSFDILILTLTGIMCWIAIFSSTFDDNFFQRFGLGVIGISTWARAIYVWEWGIGQELFVWFHLGVFVFAVGTYWKFSLRLWAARHKWTWPFPYERRRSERQQL